MGKMRRIVKVFLLLLTIDIGVNLFLIYIFGCFVAGNSQECCMICLITYRIPSNKLLNFKQQEGNSIANVKEACILFGS